MAEVGRRGAPAADGERGAVPGARRRLFFALWVDESCRAALSEAAGGLLAELSGRPVAPADWHVTLCFLGAVEERLLAPLREQAALIEAPSFSLHFERAEHWYEARVLAALAEPPAAALQLAAALRALARSLGLAPDDKPLRPHVTLARGVGAAVWRGAGARAAHVPLNVDLRVAEFHLAESGARPAGETIAGRAAGVAAGAVAAAPAPHVATAARYVSLARWPLRA